MSTKQEPLCSLSSSSRGSAAANTRAADSQRNLSSSKKATAVPALRDKMPCLDFVGFANPRKLSLAPFYTLLLLLILCASPFFLFQAKESRKPWQNIPAVLLLGEASAGTENESSL